MLQEPNIDYSSTCALIRKRIEDDRYKIRTTEANKKLNDEYLEKINNTTREIEIMSSIKEYLNPIIKDIEEYIAVRRKESMQSVNNAISIASEIVPEAMTNIHFEMKNDEAWIQTSDKMQVRMTEGTGYKSILSAFLRSVTLQANPQYLQTIIFDEIFAKVCTEYSATLSAFLNLMTETMQIISIEQKDQIYSNVDYVNYNFEKQNGVSVVTRSEVQSTQRGDENGAV